MIVRVVTLGRRCLVRVLGLLNRILSQTSEGVLGDTLAHRGDEGRGKLRKVRGRGTHPVIPELPNGGTRLRASAGITRMREANLPN